MIVRVIYNNKIIWDDSLDFIPRAGEYMYFPYTEYEKTFVVSHIVYRCYSNVSNVTVYVNEATTIKI